MLLGSLFCLGGGFPSIHELHTCFSGLRDETSKYQSEGNCGRCLEIKFGLLGEGSHGDSCPS